MGINFYYIKQYEVGIAVNSLISVDHTHTNFYNEIQYGSHQLATHAKSLVEI